MSGPFFGAISGIELAFLGARCLVNAFWCPFCLRFGLIALSFSPQNVVEKFSLCQVRCFSVLVVWLMFFGAFSPRMTKNQRQNHKEPNTLFVEPRKMSSQQKGATCFYLTTPFFPVHRQPFVATFADVAIAKRFCCDDVSVRFF